MAKVRQTPDRVVGFCRVVTASYWLLIGVLSLMANPPGVSALDFSDKAMHFFAYAGLMLISGYCCRFRLWKIFLACVLFGVTIEVLQGMGGVRQMEVLDALANTTGAAVAALWLRWRGRSLPRWIRGVSAQRLRRRA